MLIITYNYYINYNMIILNYTIVYITVNILIFDIYNFSIGWHRIFDVGRLEDGPCIHVSTGRSKVRGELVPCIHPVAAPSGQNIIQKCVFFQQYHYIRVPHKL